MSDDQQLVEEYIKLSFAMEEYTPGYIDAYHGSEEWKTQAAKDGKLPLDVLVDRTAKLTNNISKADMDEQRKDFLLRQIIAMQMSQRLLAGEKVSLAEEVEAIYDVRPEWQDESTFEEGHKELDALLPPGDSIPERFQTWKKSVEIPFDKLKDLLPNVIKKCKELAYKKFDLPSGEDFTIEFVDDKPWPAYNWYLGGLQSRIDINTDLPVPIYRVADLIAHEGYPGHHTEHSTKEEILVRQKGYYEHSIALINAPCCVISEGIATQALNIIFSDDELEDWYRDELLPLADMRHVDAGRMMDITKAMGNVRRIVGNASFMLHDQKKSDAEVEQYLKRYSFYNDKEIANRIRFISDPLFRSYIFTYSEGYELLEELFKYVDPVEYFKRLLEEPVTPSQVRQWINQ